MSTKTSNYYDLISIVSETTPEFELNEKQIGFDTLDHCRRYRTRDLREVFAKRLMKLFEFRELIVENSLEKMLVESLT
jgi:hypothetical protein